MAIDFLTEGHYILILLLIKVMNGGKMNTDTTDAFYDIRREYLTEPQLKSWNNHNILYNTLWFESNINGPDIEFHRFSVESYNHYSFYSDWEIIELKKDTFTLKSPSGFNITADVMNGWWFPLKKFFGYGRKNKREDIVKELIEKFEDSKYLKNNELITLMNQKSNREKKACKVLLDFLEVAYTIGNISPAGWNPGTGGYDFWDSKLFNLKNGWFDKSYQEKKDIYKTAIYYPTNRKTILKWAPLLWNCYTDHSKNKEDSDWVNFIINNYYQEYVEIEGDYNIKPLHNPIVISEKDILYERIKTVNDRIKSRGEKLVASMTISES